MNLEKMRRQMARNTPDSVWRSFDREDAVKFGFLPGYEGWAEQWRKQMRIKHKGKHIIMNVSQSENYDLNVVRVQLVAVVN